MSPSELTIVLSVVTAVGGAIAGAIRWGFGRLIKSMDDNTSSQLKVAESHARMTEKIDTVFDWVVEHTTPRPPTNPRLNVVKEKRP